MVTTVDVGGEVVPVTAVVVRSADDEVDRPVLPVVVEEDGDPEGLGRTLQELVTRDGLGTVLAHLERAGHWHRVDPQCAGAPAGAGMVTEAGYGLHRPLDAASRLIAAEAAQAGDGVWWYVVESDGVLIERRVGGHRTSVGFVQWTDGAPDWRAMLLAGVSASA
jgi:hypothetical protein